MSAPDVGLLLDIDPGIPGDRPLPAPLQKIAPRHFNPDYKAWLQRCCNTRFGPWRLPLSIRIPTKRTPMHHTHDWVVISVSTMTSATRAS
jgi:hypothetical protein